MLGHFHDMLYPLLDMNIKGYVFIAEEEKPKA